MNDRPTHKQMQFLRNLAQKTGQTFEMSNTKREASHQIQRMMRSGRDQRRVEQRREADAITAAIRNDIGGATAVNVYEIVGHGASARWS